MSSSLLLVDALGIAYRAFYAITGLTTAAGRPTNAVYGFIKTIMQMERIWRPSHKLVVFDGGTPAERLELLATYKAQRPAMPPALREQLPVIDAWLDAAAIAHVRLDGREADDVVASVAVQAVAAGLDVLVASSDKDLLQMVTPSIAVVLPGKVAEKMGAAEVLAKMGVRPDQVVDALALTGDSSDNIPGVPGIGAKTAAKLLQQWQSLANALDHVDAVEPEKTRKALQEHRELIARNLLLLRLQTDIDCGASLADMQVRPPDACRLLAFSEEMEFRTLAKALREPTLY
ncbi:MAG: 5'-3' exonuclease H3TH domain-containing protein [Kiritimatiellota bacterium]|nr:5'-3' exonuclease H3TH domain-containing protein [Kiritimatiellota bacterium]